MLYKPLIMSSSLCRAPVEFMAHHPLRSLHSSYHLKIKSFLARHLLPHVAHTIRTAKTIAADLLRNHRPPSSGAAELCRLRRRRRRNKKVHPPDVIINSLEVFDVSSCLYFDSTWNSIISAEGVEAAAPPPAASEEKKPSGAEDEEFGSGGAGNEIDRLAEKFIARFHEKFRLEKQESYRRYLEMLARSA